MSLYNEAIFYHIYPLGLSGAPKQNDYSTPVHRLNTLLPWIDHIKAIGCTALYIGPLFESVGHGYETTDYKKLDSRLGTNEDLTAFVKSVTKKESKLFLTVYSTIPDVIFSPLKISRKTGSIRHILTGTAMSISMETTNTMMDFPMTTGVDIICSSNLTSAIRMFRIISVM